VSPETTLVTVTMLAEISALLDEFQTLGHSSNVAEMGLPSTTPFLPDYPRMIA
jgi:hypothetical protein